jgi:class 3 adenylate cyclase
MTEGGQVMEIVGDAVLGIFPMDEDKETACKRAYRAAIEAHRRLSESKHSDPAIGQHVAFGLALHLGEVIFGNVGTKGVCPDCPGGSERLVTGCSRQSSSCESDLWLCCMS